MLSPKRVKHRKIQKVETAAYRAEVTISHLEISH